MDTKVKTSVTISKSLLKEVDNLAKDFRSRSEFVETVLRDLVERRRREKTRLSHEDEIAVLNRIADQQGEEILETLEYQIDICNEENCIE